MNNIITISNLKKYFGEVKAVDDISFEVEQGSLFAFLGINGAGKSTTINIISTLLAKDSGTVTIDGLDITRDAQDIRSLIGMVFQGSVLDKKLSVKDNLKVRASFYGLYGNSWTERYKELCDIFQLNDIVNRPYGKLSGGQRRRVDIARALINRPKILILDEPTTGLDPTNRKLVWKIINDIRAKTNMTVFLTTHYMEESAFADKVVIIDNGKIVAQDTPIGLKDKYSSDYVRLYVPNSQTIDKRLQGCNYQYHDNHYAIKVTNSNDAIRFVEQYKDILTDFEIVKGDMDDVFLNVTGKSLGD